LSVGRLLQGLNTTQDIESFRSALLRWYRQNGRDLPWRRTRDPYAILVSEFMLQQTRVVMVTPYFEAWLRRFPNLERLANATESEVLHAWQGLGYYARARNLHAVAKTVFARFAGQCPRSIDELRALPGIGRYTANAIATFAFDKPVPIVEANIARLLARLFNITTPIDSARGRESVWTAAARIVPQDSAGVFNSALMDLGALVCLPRTPKCEICPAKPFCRAPNPSILPVKKPRPKTIKLTERHGFTIKGGRILLQQCRARWRGMWMLPESTSKKAPLHVSRFPFTHHQVTLRVFAARTRKRDSQQQWFPLRELAAIPIPSPHRRVIRDLLARAGTSPNWALDVERLPAVALAKEGWALDVDSSSLRPCRN
jgi:A/G-specific adenine glycosylase